MAAFVKHPITALVAVCSVLLALFNPASSQNRGGFSTPYPSGYPGFNGFGGFGGGGNDYNSQLYQLLLWQQLQQQQGQLQPDVLTCISPVNPADPSTFLRLTIKEDVPYELYSGLFSSTATGGAPRDWTVSGFYQPSSIAPVSGTYQVVVTRYGRTGDGCNPAALGSTITASNSGLGLNPLQPSSPLTVLQLALNLVNGNNGLRPAGQLVNPLQVTAGGVTVYNSPLRRVSLTQILGSGIAVCALTDSNGNCLGIPLTCCTIAKDQKPASEPYPPPQTVTDPFGTGVLGVSGTGGTGTVFGSTAPFVIPGGAGAGGGIVF